MNPLKVGLAIALSTVGVGSGVAFGVANTSSDNMVRVNAAISSCYVRGTLASIGLSNNWDPGMAFGTKNNNQYEKENVLLKATDEFKFFTNNLNWIGYYELGNDASKAFFNVTNNLKTKYEGYYNFYVQENTAYVTNASYLTYLVGLNGDYSRNNGTLLSYNTSSKEHTLTISLSEGDSIKLLNTKDQWYGWSNIEMGNNSARTLNYVVNDESDNIVVSHAGSYEIYLKSNGKIWMQLNSVDEATNWATSFLTATNSLCSAGGTSADHSSTLSEIWATQKSSFEAMTIGAKGTIAVGTANATIADAHDRYVHIMSRYSGTLDAFEDGPAFTSGTNRIINVSNNNMIITIVAVSALVSISIGAFFVFKKRKHQ